MAIHASTARATIIAFLVTSCSNDTANESGKGAGGTAGTSVASGGSSAGGTATASGGTPGNGGAQTGGAAGTSTAAGGSSGKGGSVSTGGKSSAGGTQASGGTPGAGGATAGDAATCTVCTGYESTAAKLGSTPAGLANLSGAAFSWKNPEVLYAHDDGGTGEVYALATDGTVRGRFVLSSSGSVDIEDMGVGPCPDGTCIYLADIGGNRSSRTEYGILRAAEPAIAATPPATPTSLSFVRFRFAYDDHAVHNAESLVVEPKTGALYVITKLDAGKPSAVYKLPQPPDATAVNTATHLVDLPVPGAMNREATSASAHPCGTGFLLRTYDTLFEFRIPSGAPFEDAFRATPVVVPAATETQSEAVAYRPDGSGYVTSGEGSAAPIYGVSCTSP